MIQGSTQAKDAAAGLWKAHVQPENPETVKPLPGPGNKLATLK